jgi:hypothetical protein
VASADCSRTVDAANITLIKEIDMRKLVRSSALATLALGAIAVTARAQEKATELTAGVLGLGYTTCDGCDGLFEAVTGGPSNGAFAGLGGASIGIGFYLSPGIALEPTIAGQVLSSDGSTLTILSLGLAVPYYFDKGWGRKGVYLQPRAALNLIDGDGDSASQFAMGLGLGTKLPLNDMAALRLQANFDYGFENADDFIASTTSFGAFFGLSVFLQ